MLFYTIGQSQIFLGMLYAGLAVGLWYDVLKLLRRLFQAGKILSLVLDLAFGAGAVVPVLAALLKANYGEMRLYALLGCLCGFVIYMGSVGPLLEKTVLVFCGALVKAVKRISGTRFMKKILK